MILFPNYKDMAANGFCKVMVLLCIVSGGYKSAVAQDLDQLRANYFIAIYDEETAKEVFELLNSSPKTDALHTAFKSGVHSIMCLHTTNPITRLKLLNTSCELIKEAVEKAPNNTEIRIMRYSIHSQIPKILGKHKNLKEDLLFLEERLLTDDISFLSLDAKLYLIKVLKEDKKANQEKLWLIEQRFLSSN